jgi:hypothetical protein
MTTRAQWVALIAGDMGGVAVLVRAPHMPSAVALLVGLTYPLCVWHAVMTLPQDA